MTKQDRPSTAADLESMQRWLAAENAWIEVVNHMLRADRLGDQPLAAQAARQMARHTADAYFGADGGAVVERAAHTTAAAQRRGDTGPGDTAGVPSVLATLARAFGCEVIPARKPGTADPDQLLAEFSEQIEQIEKANAEYYADEDNQNCASTTANHVDHSFELHQAAVQAAEALFAHLTRRGRLPSRWV